MEVPAWEASSLKGLPEVQSPLRVDGSMAPGHAGYFVSKGRYKSPLGGWVATRKCASAAFALARGRKPGQNHRRCDKARKGTNHCEPCTLDGVEDGDVTDGDVTVTGTLEVGSAEVGVLPAGVTGASELARTGRAV